MPSKTFFNLSAEKREKLLTAAKDEFSTHPFSDASINRIIRAAGIPRGSFYMYFEDKADLFYYLLRDYTNSFRDLLVFCLNQSRGNIFDACLLLFDRIFDQYSKENDQEMNMVLSILSLNKGMPSEEVVLRIDLKDLLDMIGHHMNQDLLNLETPTDLEDIITIMLSLVAPVLIRSKPEDALALRSRFINRLNLLQRGMAKQPAEII